MAGYFSLRKHSASVMAKTTVCRRWLHFSNEGLDRGWMEGGGGGGDGLGRDSQSFGF